MAQKEGSAKGWRGSLAGAGCGNRLVTASAGHEWASFEQAKIPFLNSNCEQAMFHLGPESERAINSNIDTIMSLQNQ